MKRVRGPGGDSRNSNRGRSESKGRSFVVCERRAEKNAAC